MNISRGVVRLTQALRFGGLKIWPLEATIRTEKMTAALIMASARMSEEQRGEEDVARVVDITEWAFLHGRGRLLKARSPCLLEAAAA